MEPEPLTARRLAGEVATVIYITVISIVATSTGAFYILFPELGALSHDVFTHPRGTSARSPSVPAVTPILTGWIGILICRSLPYGYVAVILNVLASMIVLFTMRSPIAPALSAGLLPLVLGVTSWWYPAGIAFGTVLLAL